MSIVEVRCGITYGVRRGGVLFVLITLAQVEVRRRNGFGVGFGGVGDFGTFVRTLASWGRVGLW